MKGNVVVTVTIPVDVADRFLGNDDAMRAYLDDCIAFTVSEETLARECIFVTAQWHSSEVQNQHGESRNEACY